MSALILTQDQQNAYDAFAHWLLSPPEDEPVMVLEGYAGTGKTTLVDTLLTDIPKMLKTLELISPISYDYEIILSATTNKACEALSRAVGMKVHTIHSVLGLVLVGDGMGNKKLQLKENASKIFDTILIIDEASFLDERTLGFIESRTENCKIFYIGDPAQLIAVKAKSTPVFNANYPTIQLEQIVRQAKDCQIKELATAFRKTVNGEEFPSFTPDNKAVIRLDDASFEAAMLKEFGRPDWKHSDSKVLAWTNKTVISYNHQVRDNLHGEPEIQVGDFAVVNSYVSLGRRCSLKTDQQVEVTKKHPETRLNVPGHQYSLAQPYITVFVPSNWALAKQRLKELREEEKWQAAEEIENKWADLRAVYACTINKSQGSTYGKVFVDLSDIMKCRNSNQVARMLYVAVSRASTNVYLKGDII